MKYLVLGAGGMVGHLITNHLIELGEIVEGVARRELPFCKTNIIDVKELRSLDNLIYKGSYDAVINAIGILNSDADNRKSQAVFLNSLLPHHLEELTFELNTKIIHISTDCVFSGKKGRYRENDLMDGKSFYDRSKALGEIRDNKNLTFRQSIIGPDINSSGKGLFHWFMQQNSEINGYEKTLWSGVTSLVLTKAIYEAMRQELTGLYQLTNNMKISKLNLIFLFNEYTKKELPIKRTDGVIQDKSLVNTRTDFEFEVPSYKRQIKDMVNYIKVHPELYKSIYPTLFN